MAAYTGFVIDVDLVIASDDHAAIGAAMDRLGWASIPGVVDVGVFDRPLDDPYYVSMAGFLVDDSVVAITDRATYARTFAESLARELGVHVATGRDYDGGNVYYPSAVKAV